MSNKHFPQARQHLKLGNDAHVVQVIHERGWSGVENAVVLVYYPNADLQNWAIYYPGGELGGHRVKFVSSLPAAQDFIDKVLPVRFQDRTQGIRDTV